MIKTVNLTTEVTSVDVTGKQNVTVKNIGNNTAYVSASPDISIGGDGVISVKAGEIITLEGVATLKKVAGQYGIHGTVYAIASNATTIELIPTNSVNFKPAAVDFSGEISDISALIPAAANAGNQLTDKAYVDSSLSEKVDKVDGMGLSSNDYTTAEKEKLAALTNYDDTAVKADIADIQGLIPSSATPENQLADKAYVSAMQSGSPYIYMTQAEYEVLTEYEADRLYWVTYPLSKCHLIWCNGECISNVGSVAESTPYAYMAIAYNPANNNGASFFSNGLKKIDIAKGVTTINNNAFYKRTNLTAVSIPEGVTSIGENAFKECTALTSISIPEGVTSIGAYAFSSCTALTDITIPEGVTSIGLYAFNSCTALTDITIPEGVTSIEMSTFSFCTSLKSVSIPSTVTDIYYDAYSNQYAPSFGGCTQSSLTITINQPKGSIEGSPWGATKATIIWTG